jgi:hypothetical protein
MADQVLTLTIDLTNNTVVPSGMSAQMSRAMRQVLLGLGIDVSTLPGRLTNPHDFTSVPNRASIVTAFNSKFDGDPNPQHATDNFTLVLTVTGAAH